MTLKEFYEQVSDNYSEELNFYRVQRDSSGERYIRVPILSKENLIERIEAEIDDPWEDIEEYEDEEEKELLEILKNEVIAEYDRIILIRKEFMERMHPGEEYEEEYED